MPDVDVAVYADGSICLDILQNRWSPTYDVSAILTSIQVPFVILEFQQRGTVLTVFPDLMPVNLC